MRKGIHDVDNDIQYKRTMSIEIKHFGPIAGGRVDLKPLTLLVGPNGCGKSHAATLVYTISRWEQDDERARFHPMIGTPDYEQIRKEAASLHKKHERGRGGIIRTAILSKIAKPGVDISLMLIGNFAVPKHELIQRGQSCASLRVKTHKHDNIQIKITKDDMDIQGINPPSIRILFDKQNGARYDGYGADELDETATIHVSPQGDQIEIYDALLQHISRNPSGDYNVHYFPAERTGLMLAHKQIVDYYMSRYDKRRSPSIPAVAMDCLRLLNSLSREQGAFAHIVNDAEKSMLRGEIVKSAHSVDVCFQQSRKNYPLRMAASSVKDLAAFFLYLRFAAKKGDLVVLEEPETSLHPKNQIELAKFIAKLINQGLYMVLTTHSPYFLEQLSHCIMAGRRSQKGLSKVLPAEECLSPDMVSVCRFKPVGKYYEIEPIKTTVEGIPQDEFLTIDDEMYQELLRLRQGNE